jgi:Flp pilus assembly protein TadD
MDIAAKRYDAALARLDAFTALQPRKEMWLAQRAEILEKAGRKEEARRSWEDARTAFATLPEMRRNTPQLSQLRSRIDAALAGAQNP